MPTTARRGDGGGVSEPSSNQGPATDRSNAPVADPTINVLQLVEAAISRQDDLRTQEGAHLRELSRMRDEHTELMRRAESERIDAIRSVDVQAVQRAAEVANTQAVTLATQVAASAEAMRVQVAAAASAASIALAAALEPVQKDIADLRRVQYEAAGSKSQVGESRQVNAATIALIGLIITIALAAFTVVGVIVAKP